MSLDKHTSDQVKHIIRELAEDGHSSMRPGDVLTRLRELGRPIGAWNIRAEFTRLTQQGFLAFDPETAYWRITNKEQEKLPP